MTEILDNPNIDVDLEMQEITSPDQDSTVDNGTLSSITKDNTVYTNDNTEFDEFLQSPHVSIWDRIWGRVENIPLKVKLLNVVLIILGGFIAVGIFLLVRQAIDIKRARTSDKIRIVSIYLGNLFSNIQEERERANILLALQSTSPIIQNDFIDRTKITDTSEKIFQQYVDRYRLRSDPILKPGLVSLDSTFATLVDLRNRTFHLKTNPFYGFYDYNVITKQLLALLGKFSIMQKLDGTLSSYAVFNNVVELEYQLRSAGIISAQQNETTYNTLRGLIKFSGQRDYMLDYWLVSTDTAVVNAYNKVVDPSLVASLKSTFEILVDSNRTVMVYPKVDVVDKVNNYTWVRNDTSMVILVPQSIFNITKWNTLSKMKISAMGKITNLLREEMRLSAERTLRISTGLIIGVILVILVFFIISVIASFIFGKTIVGPWQRLNFIQKLSIDKFVPQGMLKLLGIRGVEEAVLGLSKQRSMVILSCSIPNVEEMISPNEDSIKQFIFYLQDIIGPSISSNKGFIDRYKDTNFVALFPNVQNAVEACITIKEQIQVIEGPNPNVSMLTTMGIHKDIFTVCILGDNKHLRFSIVGKQSKISDKLESLSFTLGRSLLATKKAREGISDAKMKELKKGWVKIGYITDSGKPVQVYEMVDLDSDKWKQRKTFESIQTNFRKGVYSLSIDKLKELSEISPEDILVKLYLSKAKAYCNIRDYYVGNFTIVDVVNNEKFKDNFKSFVIEDKSVTVVELWEAIQNYKVEKDQRLSLANHIYDTYLSDQLTLPKALCEDIRDNMSDSETLFEDLDIYLREKAIDGCIIRYKESETFKDMFRTYTLPEEKRDLLGMTETYI